MIGRLAVLAAALALAGGGSPTPAPAQEPSPPEAVVTAGLLQASVPELAWREDGTLAYAVRDGDETRWRSVDPRTGEETALDGAPAAAGDGPLLACGPAARDDDGGEGGAWCDRRVVRPGLFAADAPVREVASPDGRWLAGTREGDLWVRAAARRDSSRLTSDGSPAFGYDVEGAKWSPDGRRLALKKMDRREVPTIPIVRWGEPGSPVTRRPYSRAGEPIPRPELYVVDREAGARTRVDLGGGEAPYVHVAGWSEDGEDLHVLRMSRLMDRLELLEADPETGATRTLLVETSDTFLGGLPFLQGYSDDLDAKNHVVFLGGGEGFVWTSERSGWRRLYLYDADGELVRPLTPDGSEVIRLEAVDEDGGWVYYSARPDRERPYAEALLRVPLEGGEPERLVDGPVLEDLALGPRGEFLWVLRGGLEEAPTAELRRADGSAVRTLWSGAGLLDRRPPPRYEAFTATAADGTTPLHGLLSRPRDFDPSRRYPVVEMIYAGPNQAVVPRSHLNRFLWVQQTIADLGFVVVVLDGRGTPGRGKAFHDAFHGRIGQGEIADHAAALRQAAADRPWMDLDRVGVMGHSWGGYFALRALLAAPDLYRVGVASAPAVDLADFRVSIEPYMGCLPETCPEAYRAGANTRRVDRLEGRLLLLHGTADRDVPVGETLRLVDALNGAGKRYDLVLFPGRPHGIPETPTWRARALGFLGEELGGPRAGSATGADRTSLPPSGPASAGASATDASSTAAAPGSAGSVADTAGVLEAARAFLTAFERLQWEPFRAAFAPSATAFMPFGHARRLDDREEVAAFFRTFFQRVRAAREGPTYLDIEPEDLRIDRIGEAAAVVTFHLSGTEEVGRRTLVFGRDGPNDPWGLAHLHASTLERPDRGGDAGSDQEAPSELLELNREILRRMIEEQDPELLQDAAVDEFLVVAPGGRVESLSQAVAGVESFSADATIEISDEQVARHGETAVVTGKLVIDGEMQPVGRLPPMKFATVFVRDEDRWRLLARSLTPCFEIAIQNGFC